MKAYGWVLFLLATAAPVLAQHLTLDDLLDSAGPRSAGPGLLSPDGHSFALVQHGQVVMRPVEGGTPQVLTTSSAPKSELDWSPDGKSLAYVSEGQVWKVTVHEHAARQLTHDPAGPGDPRGATDHHPLWNPHGDWLLYESGQHGFNELYVIRTDGTGEHQVAATELYYGSDVIQPGDHTRKNTPDHGDAVASDRFDSNPSWSSDGASIVYTERSRQFFSGRLLTLAFDAKTGLVQAPKVLYIAKNDVGGAWAINTAAWLPGSKQLVVVLQESGWDKLWLIDAEGGRPRPLTKGTGKDESPVVSPDGKQIAFLSNRDLPEERHIWIVPAKGGTPRRLTQLSGVEANPQWTPDSRSVYFTRGTALTPPVAYVASVDGREEPKSLESVSASKFADLGIAPEVAHYKGKDGLALAGILYKPAHFDPGKRYPTVIWAHGGPEGQTTLSLSPWSLFLADRGYVVLEPNFRGSTGYGERFRNSNVEDSGGGEIDDTAASVQYLVNAGIADPKRVAIGGGSHGGTVVANAVAKLPDTFAAGIEMFGVVDRALFLKYTNRNSAIRWETKMGGTPDQKPAVYQKANVLLQVEQIKTPLLILHGEEDPQVPPQESQEFVTALKAAGKVYEYHTYPREGHGFQERDHRRDSYERQLAFLNRYLQQTN